MFENPQKRSAKERLQKEFENPQKRSAKERLQKEFVNPQKRSAKERLQGESLKIRNKRSAKVRSRHVTASHAPAD